MYDAIYIESANKNEMHDNQFIINSSLSFYLSFCSYEKFRLLFTDITSMHFPILL